MNRGRQQILFNFLPGKTFDHESGQAICRVKNFRAEEDNKINHDYVLYKVSWLLNQWPPDQRRGFPDPYQYPNRYVFAAPQAVEAELFPLLFYCINPNCRRTFSYLNIDQINQRNPHLSCQHCGAELTQLHHVLIHKCGHIRSFIMPSCSIHGYDHMWLDTMSQKYSLFRWHCLLCNFQTSIIPGSCDDCNLSEKNMRPVVHRASPSFYTQFRTMINLPGQDLSKILDDPERHWLAIAAYLRLFEHGPNNRLIDLVATPQGDSAETESIKVLERLIRSAPPETKAMLQSQLTELKQGLSNLGGDQRSQIINKAKSLITLQDDALEVTGEELLEFVRPDETLKITTLDQLEQKAKKERSSRLSVYRAAYRDALRDTGLSSVSLIGDFPITVVVIGYTRDEREADNTIIRAFPRLQRNDPRTPLFVDTTETEALMFCLNPVRVYQWLKQNELTGESNLNPLEDETEIRAWILNQMQTVDPFKQIPDSDPVNCAVFSLVHSFSHLVLRQAVIQSGFDRTSLSEYLFPRALSFVIYSNNRSSFTIGGLYTLFEQTLHEHLRSVIDRSENCVYDPVCIGKTGACHACIYISEMSCEHFNRNLNRKYLFGCIEQDENEFIGYWDERCNV